MTRTKKAKFVELLKQGFYSQMSSLCTSNKVKRLEDTAISFCLTLQFFYAKNYLLTQQFQLYTLYKCVLCEKMAFSAQTLLVAGQEGHPDPACKILK